MNKKDSIYYNSFIHSYKNKKGLGVPGSHGRPVFGVNPDNYFLGNHKDIFPNPNPSSELLSNMYGYNKEPGLYGRPSFGVNDDNFFSGKHIFPAPIQNTSNDNNEKNSSNFFYIYLCQIVFLNILVIPMVQYMIILIQLFL